MNRYKNYKYLIDICVQKKKIGGVNENLLNFNNYKLIMKIITKKF